MPMTVIPQAVNTTGAGARAALVLNVAGAPPDSPAAHIALAYELLWCLIRAEADTVHSVPCHPTFLNCPTSSLIPYLIYRRISVDRRIDSIIVIFRYYLPIAILLYYDYYFFG